MAYQGTDRIWFDSLNKMPKSPLRFVKYSMNPLHDNLFYCILLSRVNQLVVPWITYQESPAICHDSIAIPFSFWCVIRCFAWCLIQIRFFSFVAVCTRLNTNNGCHNKSLSTNQESSWRLVDSQEYEVGVGSRSTSWSWLAWALCIDADFFQVAHIALKLSDNCFWNFASNWIISSCD